MPADVNMKLWNIAPDLAINSHLHNLPEGGLIPGEPDTPFEHLPRGESAEWYLANMPEFDNDKGDNQSGPSSSESQGQGSSGGDPSDGDSQSDGIPDTLDDHSGWQECSQEVKDMAKERLKEVVRKAAEEASASNRWGSVSHDTRKKVMKMLETKVDWRKVLRYFVKSSQRATALVLSSASTVVMLTSTQVVRPIVLHESLCLWTSLALLTTTCLRCSLQSLTSWRRLRSSW